MPRLVIPSLFSMAATTSNWNVTIRQQVDQLANNPAARQRLASSANTVWPTSVQLRWMTRDVLGLPRQGFTVWYRPPGLPRLTPLPGQLGGIGSGTSSVARFSELQAVVRFDFANSGTTGYSLVGYAPGGQIVAFALGNAAGNVSLQITASGMDSAILTATGTVTAISGLSTQAFANADGWTEIEAVGLPYDEPSFAGSGYSAAKQGLVTAPLGPVPAALRRLVAGPPVGWSPGIGGGLAPPWSAPNAGVLVDALQSKLLSRVRTMLAQSSDPLGDAKVKLTETLQAPRQPDGSPETKMPSTSELPPLLLLLLNASSDPFNALALGYGTSYSFADIQAAMRGRPVDTLGSFLVECPITIGNTPVRLADFVVEVGQVAPPAPPAPLVVLGSAINRPTNKTQPATAAIGIAWPRPSQIATPLPRVASYGIARSAAGSVFGAQYDDLIEPRPGGGPSAYVATRNPHAPLDGVGYVDGTAPRPAGAPPAYTYAAVAQDLFGQWSGWSTVAAPFPDEPFIVPRVGAGTFVASPNAGGPSPATLTVEVTWDWSDREPAEIDLNIALFRPANAAAPLPGVLPPASGLQLALGAPAQPALRLSFGAGALPTPNRAGVTVSAVAPMLSKPPNSLADVRTYSVVIPGFTLDFAGTQQVFALVWVAGSQRITPAVMNPGQGRGAYGAQNPNPPLPPSLGGPQFSSLPDHLGIARAHLTWSGGGPRWAVYEATETAVLSQAGLPAADVKASWVTRLAVVKGLNMATIKTAFRRITASPLTSPELEVVLPRGTAVMHLYAVRSVGDNNLESAFPTATTALAAVAVPRVRVPAEPSLRADLVGASGSQSVRLQITSRRGVQTGRFDLFRTSREALSRDVDLMGPALARSDGPGFTLTPNADGTVTAEHTDTAISPSWDAVTYRSTAWGIADTVGGFRAGRSRSSSGATVVLPPPAATPLAPVVLQQATPLGSIVSTQAAAPAAPTALGSHRLTIQTRDPAQHFATMFRVDLALETLPFFKTFLAGVAAGGPARVFRYPAPAGFVNIAAYVPLPVRTPPSTGPYRVVASLTDPLNRVSAQSLEVAWS